MTPSSELKMSSSRAAQQQQERCTDAKRSLKTHVVHIFMILPQELVPCSAYEVYDEEKVQVQYSVQYC